jgi:tRNA (guanine-N7-)-methyltransferase
MAGETDAPKKKFFRQRAHSNPYNANVMDDIAPAHPSDMDWARLYPAHATADGSGAIQPPVQIADVGCGFGGLLMGLAAQPSTASTPALGMEIRLKVSEYVRVRIENTRRRDGSMQCSSVVRSNAMRYFPHYFAKGQLTKVFTCFPDPHFKRAKHDRRIVSQALLADYAYSLAPGGRLYTITDVYDLHVWMRVHGENHHAFRALTAQEISEDPCIPVMATSTEESHKVDREGRGKFAAVFQRLTDAEATARHAELGGLWGQPDSPALYDGEMEQWRLHTPEEKVAAEAAVAACSMEGRQGWERQHNTDVPKAAAAAAST